MSYPARYPPYTPNRYTSGSGYPPFFAPINRPRPPPGSARPVQDTPAQWPTPHAHPPGIPGAHWTAPGIAPEDFRTTPFYHPEEELAYPPASAHPPTPWASLPRELQLDVDPVWGPVPVRPGAYNHDWYGWPGGPDQSAIHKPYAQLEYYNQHYNRHASRSRWREEILRGDPDKAIAEHTVETITLVISFITRGPANHPHGQGDELLFFRPRRKDPTRYQYAQDMQGPWTYLAIEASPIVPLDPNDVVTSPDELSAKSITGLIPTIDPAKDLRLVRKSMPLRWDCITIIQSYLYRLAEGKEDPDSEGFKELESRLGGPDLHYFTALSGFHSAVDSDIVSTAMLAVCLPHAVSMGIDDIFADQESRSDTLSQKALDVLYLCVQAGYARSSFRYYPIPPPPDGQLEFEVCVKRRIWAYWTEVTAWHLSQIRPDARVSISYTLLKALSAIKASVDDNKVTVEELEKLLVNAIATEADRSRNAGRILIREGVSEILYNSNLAPEGDASEKMHIITASSSSVVFNVVAKLITHVLSGKSTSTGGSKSNPNRRIMDMKITIAESRPLSEGVALALRLSHVVDSYIDYRDRTTKSTNRASAAPSIADLGPAALDNNIQARMRQAMLEAEQLRSPMRVGAPTLGLAHLLADMDSKKEKKEPKVTIELITDAAAVSAIMASGAAGSKPIVLLSADRILSNGTVVNKVGSAQMAWAGKSSGAVVLILSRADRVHSKGLPAPAKPTNPPNELYACWKSIIAEQSIDDLVASSHVTVSNPTYEEVEPGNITGYITELGFMENEMLTEFSNMRSDLEKLVWGL